jgi:hypothetical protein
MPHARAFTRGLRSIILVTLLLAAIGALADRASAQGTIIDRSTTVNALAGGQICADTCSDVSVTVTSDQAGTSTVACLTVTTETADGTRIEESCPEVGSAFAMDTDVLAWAELAPTSVELYTWVCDGKACDPVYTRTVTLAATWTGTGDIGRHRETLGDHTGPCASYSMVDGRVRDAEITVSVDGAGFTVTGDDVLQVIEETRFQRAPCA